MMNINARFLQKLSLLLSIFGGTNGFLWQGDKCTTWIKTDGSGCRINSFFNFEKLAMNYKRKTTGENICCNDGTGCFSTEKDTPWECHLELPSCMDKVKPDFMVFKHDQTEQEPYQIDYFNLNSSVESLQLDDKPFFIIIHGYGRKWPLNWMFNIKDRLVKLGNNVMIVRWTGGSTDELGYFKAAANTRSVGAAVAMVAKSLQFHGRISLNRTTIIGFSLGGQTAGAAGRNLPGLRRIIGGSQSVAEVKSFD
uniref:Lipase domain-containing protein n=1 Tax=Romanomermis culicivorax TaxID=13658 RepID=A0A915J6Y3_ROMCU